jgi:hypothetical protein
MNLVLPTPIKSPTISVVMPVYNSAEFLAESIESILAQSYNDFEFIILDDGSTDQSWEIIQDYASKDIRIKTHQNDCNKGIFFTRNLGLDKSTGKYIGVMDADDISLPDRFTKQFAFLDSHPDIDVLGGQIIKFGQAAQSGKKSNYPLTPGGVRWGLVSGCQLAHSTVMMRSHLFSVEGFQYREFKVAQDYDLWTRLSPGHNIANLSDVLVQYRVHQSSISGTNGLLQKHETIRIIKEYVRNMSGINLPEEIIKGLMITKEICSVGDALILSKVLLTLEKLSKKWELGTKDRGEISHQAAYKLVSICKHFNYNPRLLPCLITAGLLESKAIQFGMFEDSKNGN